MKLLERIIKEGTWRQVEDADTMWDTMAECIQRSTKEILGTSRRCGSKMKAFCWWNEDVKEKVKEKKRCMHCFRNGMNEEKEISRVRYKAAKKLAKKAVAVAKSIAYDRLYQKLEMKKGEKEVFKLAKARERRTRDLSDIRYIKDENGKVLARDAEIKARWPRYFSKLLNGKVLEDFRSRE